MTRNPHSYRGIAALQRPDIARIATTPVQGLSCFVKENVMRTLPLLLTTSLLVIASGASAQSSSYPLAASSPMETIQVTAPLRTVWLKDEQARQIAGAYAMSNGWDLNVRTRSSYIDATIDSEQPIRLMAISSDKFVSRNGNVTMQFNQGNDGDEMTMSYVPQNDLAQLVIISAKMAQR
jgi:hypothetical protein